jgi:DHA1 family tetracycline resistance protein-like MFS transporter
MTLGQRPPRQAAFAFIFVTILLDMLALGSIIPVLPRLVVAMSGGNAAHGAWVFGLFGTAWALMQFLFSPVQGALSDRFGRRPVVLASNFGLGLDYLIMALAPSLGWLFVGRIINGITSASMSTAFAYIADVTPPERRAGRFGLLGAAFGAGFVLGPALGGILGEYDPRLPFWLSAALSLANGCYGLFVLPESLPMAKRSAFSLRQANPLGSLTLLRTHPNLLGLASIHFLGQLAHVVLPSTFVLYASYRYGWGERLIGLTLAGVGVASMIVQAGLVGRTVALFGERRALMLGLLAGAAGFAIYGLAPVPAIFWIGVPVMSFWGLASPSVQGLMSRLVGPSEQSRLQGAASSLTGIAGLIGPGLFTGTFAVFVGRLRNAGLPGSPFLLAAVFLSIALLLAWRIAPRNTPVRS